MCSATWPFSPIKTFAYCFARTKGWVTTLCCKPSWPTCKAIRPVLCRASGCTVHRTHVGTGHKCKFTSKGLHLVKSFNQHKQHLLKAIRSQIPGFVVITQLPKDFQATLATKCPTFSSSCFAYCVTYATVHPDAQHRTGHVVDRDRASWPLAQDGSRFYCFARRSRRNASLYFHVDGRRFESYRTQYGQKTKYILYI